MIDIESIQKRRLNYSHLIVLPMFTWIILPVFNPHGAWVIIAVVVGIIATFIGAYRYMALLVAHPEAKGELTKLHEHDATKWGFSAALMYTVFLVHAIEGLGFILNAHSSSHLMLSFIILVSYSRFCYLELSD